MSSFSWEDAYRGNARDTNKVGSPYHLDVSDSTKKRLSRVVWVVSVSIWKLVKFIIVNA